MYEGVVRRTVARLPNLQPRPLEPEAVDETCDRLSSAKGPARELYLRNSPRALRAEVALALTHRSFAKRATDFDQALDLGRLAVRLARHPKLTAPSPAVRADVLAEAAANLANLLRIKERYTLADRLLAFAAERGREGTGDLLVRGFHLRCVAALRRHQRRFAEAVEAAKEAEALYRRLGDARNRVIASILEGTAHLAASEPALAHAAISKALPSVHLEKDRVLAFTALHNLILTFEALGDTAWAYDEMRRADVFYKMNSSPLFDLRAGWVRGRLQCANGELGKARKSLEAAKAGFMARGLHYDAALAGLDLGLVYAELGEVRQLAELSREMWHVFTAKKIPREAAATLLLFADTARRWQAKPEFIRGLLAELAPVRRATGR